MNMPDKLSCSFSSSSLSLLPVIYFQTKTVDACVVGADR